MTHTEAREYIVQSDLPDSVISDCLAAIDDNKDEFEPNQCPGCGGSGMGAIETMNCTECRGSGEERETEYQNDFGNIDPIFSQLLKPYSPKKEAA